MRVLFPFVGDSVGGSHVSAADLIGRLAGTDVAPCVLVHRQGPLGAYLTDRGISFTLRDDLPHLRGQSGFKLLRSAVGMAPTLARAMRELAIDALHTNDKRIHLSWLPAARLARCRSLVHLRLLGPQLQLEETVRRGIIAAGTRLVCVSQAARETLPRSLARRAIVLHDPCDWDHPRPDRAAARAGVCRELGLADRSFILGTFGTLNGRKRPAQLVEVAAALRRARPGVQVVALLAGRDEGELASVMHKADALGMTAHLRYLGFRTDVPALMAACDLVLAPALNEAFGRTLLEACAVGTPVFATDAAGHREILGPTAPDWLMPVEDPAAIAARVLALMETHDTAGSRMAGIRSDLARRFAFGPYVEAIRQLYQS